MSHPGILILGYSEAGMLLRNRDAANVRALIAIHGQREYPIEIASVTHKLVLRFDDTESPSTTDPLHAARVAHRQRKAAEFGLSPTPPTADHARSIIDFARSIAELDGMLLCQCHAGISRSSAAALLCLAAWTGPGQEQHCVERLLSVRPSAVPHRNLVTFGDELLQREGALVEALHRARIY